VQGHEIMLENQENKQVQIPLLTRLLDNEPDNIYENKLQTTFDIHSLHENIKTNLENLLNSRSKCLRWPKEYQELNQSLANYGMNDFMHRYFDNQQARLTFCKEVEETIAHFEPRLKTIHVTLLKDEEKIDRVLRIRIEAIIDANKQHNNAVFESSVDVSAQQFNFE